MKKTKNGFTFVELLGTITIIGIITLIITPTIDKILKENEKKIYQSQLDNIILSLKNWASDNRIYLPEKDGESLTIMLGNLKADGYIEYNIKNPNTNKCFDNKMTLEITKVNKTYKYSIQEGTIKDSDNCDLDLESPTIILNGNPIENIEINSVYVDKGVIAKDNNGNDITSEVITTISGSDNKIDTSKLGSQYVVNYSVTFNNKTTSISKTVKIVDTTQPVLTIPDNVILSINDTEFDLMSGVSVSDNSGETIQIITKNNIVFGIAGKYTVEYSSSDSSGNITTKKRTVTIVGQS